jgi:hypothetical protein
MKNNDTATREADEKPINQSALITSQKQTGKSISPVSLAATSLNMLFATCPFR